MCYLSDDAGRTWRRSKTTLVGRGPTGERVTVQEPGVVQLTDGRLKMFCRTDAGSQYVAHSADGGDAWSELVGIPSSQSSLSRVEPGSPEDSYMYLKLIGKQEKADGSGLQMPVGQNPLNATQIEAIRKWIEQGAKKN